MRETVFERGIGDPLSSLSSTETSWFAGFGKNPYHYSTFIPSNPFVSIPRDSKMSTKREPIKTFAFSLTATYIT